MEKKKRKKMARMCGIVLAAAVLINTIPIEMVFAEESEVVQYPAEEKLLDGAGEGTSEPETAAAEMEEVPVVTEEPAPSENGGEVSDQEGFVAEEPDQEKAVAEEPVADDANVAAEEIVQESEEQVQAASAEAQAAASVTISFDGDQQPLSDKFVFTPRVMLPANGTGNVLKIILPQYVTLVRKAGTDGTMTSFDAEKKDNGTTEITMGFVDTSSVAVDYSVDLRLNQSEFRKRSSVESYEIHAEFKNDQEASGTAVGNYTVDNLDYNSDLIITGGKTGFIIGDPKEKGSWKLEIAAGFDLDDSGDGSNLGYVRLYEIEELRKYMNITGQESVDYISGSDEKGVYIDVAIKKSMIKDARTLSVDLPLEINVAACSDYLFQPYEFVFNGKVHMNSNNKEQEFLIKSTNEYFALDQTKVSDSGNIIQLSEMIQKNGKISKETMINLFGRPSLLNIDTTVKNSYIENMIKDLSLSFKIPDYLEWYGEGKDYDDASGRVTLGSDYIKFAQVQEGERSYWRIYFIKDIPLRIQYKISGDGENDISEINKENFLFTEVEYKIITNDEVSSKQNFMKEQTEQLDYDIAPLGDGVSPSKLIFGNNQAVMQGDKDALLATWDVSFEKDKSYPYEIKTIDMVTNKSTINGTEYSMSEYMHINRVEFSIENIKAIEADTSKKFEFHYRTNATTDGEADNKVLLSGLADKGVLNLPKGEFIVKFKIVTPSQSNKSGDMNLFKMYGDVEDLQAVPGNGESYFKCTYPLEGEVGSESKTSTYREYMIPDGLEMKLFPITGKYSINESQPGGWKMTGDIKPWYEKLEGSIEVGKIDFPKAVEKVELELNQDTKPLSLSGFSVEGEWIEILSAEYTTDLAPTAKKEVSGPQAQNFSLDKGVFNSLTLLIKTSKLNGAVSQNYGGLKFYFNLEEGVTQDKLNNWRLFNIVDSPQVEKGEVNCEISVSDTYTYKHNVYLYPGDKESPIKGSPYKRGDALQNDIIEMPYSIYYWGDSDTQIVEDYQWNSTNPTFYLAIPKDYEYRSITFRNGLEGKKPEVNTFTQKDGTTYLRIRFYGVPTSDTGLERSYSIKTGFADGLLENCIRLDLRVKKLSRVGKLVDEIQSYTDLNETLHDEELIKKGLVGEYYIDDQEGVNLYGVKSSLYDPLENRNISLSFATGGELIKEKMKISYGIWIGPQTSFDISANTESNVNLTRNLIIRSGETFNALAAVANMDRDITAVVMYIPVSQGGGGETDEQWKMKLLEIKDNSLGTVEILVSEDLNATKGELTGLTDAAGMYRPLDEVMDLSKVTMVKVTADKIAEASAATVECKFTNAEPYKGDEANKSSVKMEYAYTDAIGERHSQSAKVDVTLQETKLKGRLFIDKNEDGIMDAGEEGVKDKAVVLYDQNDQEVTRVTSSADGTYQLDIPALLDGYYLMINEMYGYALTAANNQSTDASQRSWFDYITRKAVPTLENADYLNAGFIKMPEIQTEKQERVVGDPIGNGNDSAANVAAYLMNRPIVGKDGADLKPSALTSVVKVAGPDSNTLTDIDVNDNYDLTLMMNTVGSYKVEIQFMDKNGRVFYVSQVWDVAGKIEFGFGGDDKGTKFREIIENGVLNIRTDNTEYIYKKEGLRARYRTPDGTYVYMKTVEEDTVHKIEPVKAYVLEATTPHPYKKNDDGERPISSVHFNLLSHGLIGIYGSDKDIYTRVGTEVDPLKIIHNETWILDAKGTYTRVRLGANNIVTAVEKTTADPPTIKADHVGVIDCTITGDDSNSDMDPVSGGNINTFSAVRKIYVESVPEITCTEKFSVGKDTTVEELTDKLKADATYFDSKNIEQSVPDSDIHVNYDEVLAAIQAGTPGQNYPITITVNYKDNNIQKSVMKTADIYLLNEPDTAVKIPAYLELKKDGADEVSAKADVSLQGVAEVDKDSIPAVNITVDKEISLVNGGSAFTAKTYKNDGITPYDASTPIMSLKYRTLENDYFYLKAGQKDIDKEGRYEGILNFTMEYEGR